MDIAVSLVRSYLQINGFFTLAEMPVLEEDRDGFYRQTTDLDLIGIRFPWAVQRVARGREGPVDDLEFEVDERLDLRREQLDVLLCEVKQGRARMNAGMLKTESLRTALYRLGVAPRDRLERAIEPLLNHGEAFVEGPGERIKTRVRLFAFGDGVEEVDPSYSTLELADIASFVRSHLRRHRSAFHAAHWSEPALGLLHLLEKLD